MVTKSTSHANILRDAFERANTGNFIALANIGQSQDEGWDEVREEVARRGLKDPTSVFWHRESNRRGFDKKGNLAAHGLVLHWSGDKNEIVKLLQTIPVVEFVTPKTETMSFIVRPVGAAKRPDPSRPDAVIEYLGRMEMTPEVFLDDEALDWLMAVATGGDEDMRRELLGAINNEHALPPALVDVYVRDEAKLIDEDCAFDYLNMVARNDKERYRTIVTTWATGPHDWQRYEAAFMLGDTEGKLAETEALALLDRLMQDKDASIVENAVRSWMLYRSARVPEDRIRLCIELLNDSGRSNLIKRFAAANVSLVSEMTKPQATQIMELLNAQKIDIDKSDLAHYKKRAK